MEDSSKQTELNETRYEEIAKTSSSPWKGLLKESLKEDKTATLPRVILKTFGTVRSIPRLYLRLSKKRRKAFAARRLRKWATDVCRMANVKLDVVGKENIPSGQACLFVCNHMSPMDIPALFAATPVPIAFVANYTFSTIPLFRFWTKHSGSVYVRQGDSAAELGAFKDIVETLKDGTNLLIFPEGYIFQGEGLAEFKRGGISAAVLAQAPIVPVCLWGTQEAMPPGRLYIKPSTRIHVEFGSPIETKGMSRSERKNVDQTVYDILLDMKTKASQEQPEASYQTGTD